MRARRRRCREPRSSSSACWPARRTKPTTSIDQRTFSWTAFFGLIEKTLPLDARLVAVSPRVERGVFKIVMLVVARRLSDVQEFIEKLKATGAFYDVVPAGSNSTRTAR